MDCWAQISKNPLTVQSISWHASLPPTVAKLSTLKNSRVFGPPCRFILSIVRHVSSETERFQTSKVTLADPEGVKWMHPPPATQTFFTREKYRQSLSFSGYNALCLANRYTRSDFFYSKCTKTFGDRAPQRSPDSLAGFQGSALQQVRTWKRDKEGQRTKGRERGGITLVLPIPDSATAK